MVLRARGMSPSQAKLHATGNAAGRDFLDLLKLVQGAEVLCDARDDVPASTRAALAAGRAVALEVNSRIWIYLPALQTARSHYPGVWPGESQFLHAVLLYAMDEGNGLFMPEDEFLVLDPAFPKDEQPMRLTEGNLRDVCIRAVAV